MHSAVLSFFHIYIRHLQRFVIFFLQRMLKMQTRTSVVCDEFKKSNIPIFFFFDDSFVIFQNVFVVVVCIELAILILLRLSFSSSVHRFCNEELKFGIQN